MMICSVTGNGKTILLLGLSTANVERLQEDQPMRITRESHGMAVPGDLVVLLMHGETEAAIEARLRAIGVLDATTVMNQSRPL